MRPTSQYIASLPEAEHSLSPSQLKQGVAQVLYQNVDAIRALLYESAPILDSWAKAQVKAQQLTNPKGAGRKPANPVLMFLILLVRSFLGLSNTKLARVLVSDLSVLSSSISPSFPPSVSTSSFSLTMAYLPNAKPRLRSFS